MITLLSVRSETFFAWSNSQAGDLLVFEVKQ